VGGNPPIPPVIQARLLCATLVHIDKKSNKRVKLKIHTVFAACIIYTFLGLGWVEKKLNIFKSCPESIGGINTVLNTVLTV